MSGNIKKEFGDYQTPKEFCHKVCSYLKKHGYSDNIKEILEPTCGKGNFLSSACMMFEINRCIGVEINEEYINETKEKVPDATLINNSIFEVNTRELCETSEVLVIGNPPWATNSQLSYNLPKKINFRKLRGIDALTGSSNFDICEYIILKLLDEFQGTDSIICMLCKTSVARNVLLEISRNQIMYSKIEMLTFNSNKVFGVSAPACVFMIKLSSKGNKNENVICEVKEFDSELLIDTLSVNEGIITSLNSDSKLEGECQLIWRQGVKHDCSKVMELAYKNGVYINKNKEIVSIEKNLVFPLVKSSDFKKPILNEFSKYVIVTQSKPKQDTSYIQKQFPYTWKYLNDNIEKFNNRKSVIYKKAPLFSMFGIGEYSFAPYKVGLSGFYKKPLFSLLHSNKPVMTDDTAYFVAFEDYEIAYTAMLILNTELVQNFLISIAFLDNKRPYTVKLLSRLDIEKCTKYLSFDDIKKSEKNLQLKEYVTEKMYDDFIHHITNKKTQV